ncbi:biotin--[acetyl-CoA-carboxylase] ligase [Cellulophaga sp. HaHaR_3_176]|uniref:biotin--[acetyl-CoA-carboxylase] ligase n=1 Tax=Cellulophaga sp. HaHaR_3_176 TaxID=1942464 RepID=UPI001C1F5398|nr:biotin--[acetyl-CoA-carboxylase] ligase [Cellulophaga sp. HaHaR_3_176]QWX84383.1 biotin--[acetyl-CoA-carboxylase] ligase [Cellulophaga sp. HaHaR_3_176]
MQIIKLDATDSTSLYLKNLIPKSNLDDFTVVTANRQTKGRGQMGTTWLSEDGKNLTFSFLKKNQQILIADQFLLNICVSLGVYYALEELKIPDLKVKWPNDILSGKDKICGILIENILSGAKIQASVVGIGLNVNQLSFSNLPNVSSLKLILGRTFDLEESLLIIMKHLKILFKNISEGKSESLKSQYLEVLFRKDKPSTFKDTSDQMFPGIIRGISNEGKLVVEIEDEILKEYDLKEVKLLY